MSFTADAWEDVDTVLLDMDGTLLDLAFDNYFWRELVPRTLARTRGEPLASASRALFDAYAGKEGSLDWYCLDYWAERLALDLVALKLASSQRIRFLPGAREFLAAAEAAGKRLVLVTNAHRQALALKKAVTGLDRYLDLCISAHEIGWPKEQAGFWPALHQRLGFDPARTAFIDDSLPVLAAARAYGIATLYAIAAPDSRLGLRNIEGYAAIRGLGDLLREPSGSRP